MSDAPISVLLFRPLNVRELRLPFTEVYGMCLAQILFFRFLELIIRFGHIMWYIPKEFWVTKAGSKIILMNFRWFYYKILQNASYFRMSTGSHCSYVVYRLILQCFTS